MSTVTTTEACPDHPEQTRVRVTTFDDKTGVGKATVKPCPLDGASKKAAAKTK